MNSAVSQVQNIGFNMKRLSPQLQAKLAPLYDLQRKPIRNYLQVNQVYQGDARTLLQEIEPNSIGLSVWSPPYFVGKNYEADLIFDDWKSLLSDVIEYHFPVIKPGGFLAINIADILVFKDPDMPQIQADVVRRKRSLVTKEQILAAKTQYPNYNRHQLAKLLGCSEQTIDRRLNGNNIRGGKSSLQTRVKIVGGLIEEWALNAGFYTYDRRIWVKDAAWENSRWTSLSYRAVDEFEYLYIFWKPGITKVDRGRLTPQEWRDWGSRGIWNIASVRANNDHEAKFPVELPERTIKLLTDPEDVVLDCFMGSGSTAVAAIRHNRQYIGVERDPEYVKLSNNNIDFELKQLKLC